MESLCNRFFVLDDGDMPDDVRNELEAYESAPSQRPTDTRGVAEDIAINVLGGLVSSGIWDQLPLWAAWWSGFGSTPRRADAEQVTNGVVALCVRTGLAKKRSEVSVDQLIEVPRAGWSGRASSSGTVVSFRTDKRGRIVMFDTVTSTSKRG